MRSTAPTISSVSLKTMSSSAEIRWTTNEPSDTQVEYGSTTSYGSRSPLDTRLLTSHTVTLSRLRPGTVYYFRVLSRDAAGNLGVSKAYRLKTKNR